METIRRGCSTQLHRPEEGMSEWKHVINQAEVVGIHHDHDHDHDDDDDDDDDDEDEEEEEEEEEGL